MNINDKTAVFVDSFDGYCDVWDVFWDIFSKYGSSCPFKKYQVTNEIEYKRNGVINIKVGKEINWFDRTIKAVKKVREEYIMFFLEDYFPSKEIDFNEICRIVKKMEDENVFLYRLSMRKGLPLGNEFVKMRAGSEYPITLQLGIWKKEMLERILEDLRKAGCKSPWDFEFFLKENYDYCPAVNGELEGIRFDTRDIIGYKNGLLRGKWFPDVKKYYLREGIDFTASDREELSNYQLFRYKLICFMASHFSSRSKNWIKLIVKKKSII